ncbi:protein kinase, catalytic domain-containingprotein [Fusarium austroafricanum]|uniref:Protein kinase, catalytic domain-containingprotein n=1 Tax=Fusarium austroafricanum TaxID=2364996 RepID=A0A8H4JDF4_9HYPO|nr:protein kinase, catalytic domain-containingprotein [Fusarium austroafricanum]
MTQLVDTLRNYNIELANLLPFYRLDRFERRIGRVLVTTRQLAASLADIGSKINTTSGVDTGELGGQYSLMARLLESKHETEAFETDPSKPVDESSQRLVEAFTYALPVGVSQASLHLRASEVQFDKRDVEGFRAREFGSYEASPVIIEWRYYSSKETRETRSSVDVRVHMLTIQLQQLSSLHHTGVLPCLGYFHDHKRYRYGITFRYPRNDGAALPTSLADRLHQDQKRRIRRDLGDRLRAARSLIGTVYQMLCELAARKYFEQQHTAV